MNPSDEILQSWNANAKQWIATIDNDEIESRVAATNDAIIKAILEFSPKTILDIGCGEGWLTRTLRQKGIKAYGVDGIAALIENAVQKDGAFYYTYTYEEISAGKHSLLVPFDAVVINFALIDKEYSEKLIHYIPSLLKNNGLLFVQTLHPLSIAADSDYITGWKEASWNGMKQKFVLPYQWYFRTMEDWMSLFKKAGFYLEALHEPIHPQTHKPLSVIFVLRTSKIYL